MSDQAFENAVAERLRATAGVFVYHPPDLRMARLWKPGDFIVGGTFGFEVLECKEVSGGDNFPLSKWSPQQRVAATAVAAGGGDYWLVVRYQPARTVAAFLVGRHVFVDSSGGLAPDDGAILTHGRSFTLEPVLQRIQEPPVL